MSEVTPTITQDRVISSRAKKKGKRKVAEQYSQLKVLKIVYKKPEDLNPNFWNPNRQSEREFETLVNAMEDHGFTTPILVTSKSMTIGDLVEGDGTGAKMVQFYGKPLGTVIDNVIVDGEHRWRAAVALSYDEIPLVYTDMEPAQAMAATISQNVARGSHDMGLEAAVFQDLEALGMLDTVVSSLQMSDQEVQLLMEDTSADELFADAEFGEAWVPGEAAVDGTGLAPSTDGQEVAKNQVTASTTAAVEVQQLREAALAAAKTDEEKTMAQEDNAIFRLSLIFAGVEAELVRKVLGRRPAEVIIAYCREVGVDGEEE